MSPPPVETHDAGAVDGLREVLVRGADDHLLQSVVRPVARGRGGEGVIGLELHHGPGCNSECRDGLFSEVELGQKVLRNALAGLVAIEQIVAKRLDDVVERAGDVRNSLVPQQNKQRLYKAPYGPDGPSVGRRGRRHPEVRPEQLVCAVNEIQLHWTGWALTRLQEKGVCRGA